MQLCWQERHHLVVVCFKVEPALDLVVPEWALQVKTTI